MAVQEASRSSLAEWSLVESRGKMAISTSRGLPSGMSAEEGCHLCRSLMTTGTTSTLAASAILKGPLLKDWSLPSRERVPSGKATIEFPFWRLSTAALNVSSCDRRSLRRNATWPANAMAQPMSGMRRISIFDTYLMGLLRKPDSVSMSRYEQWFGAYSTASPFAGKFSSPVTRGRYPHASIESLAHQATTASMSLRRFTSNA
mmetsp:Transcript_17451/g.53221  ORF Transcript_17451/g.53221 Transcript_17451/m.53221 type:complete len:203 (-) Transcript_17451:339-947(-)